MAALFTACFLCLFVIHVRAYSQLVNKTTIVKISSEYAGYDASRTVDGDFDQHVTSCSHTNNLRSIREAWLHVDLGAVYSVKSVKFWYRGDRTRPYYNTERLRGYSIRVSNDTKVPPPESSCYLDPGNVTLPTIVEEDCERTTRYVWIYQSNKPNYEPCPMLEICEVQVSGCKVGYYGPQCLNKCDHCKNSATCGVKNGECDVQGCSNTGYEPPLCKKCVRGTYGLNCTKQCSRFCINDDCNRTEGFCLKGCEIGYRGNFCNETCRNGSYGPNCSETCGNCLKDRMCHHVNGTCLEGCAAGYKTHDCNTTCNDGEYGVNCRFNCSGYCLNGEMCNKIDGSCRSCAIGYKGMKCDKECEAGKYGKACHESCGACLNSTVCNHITGICELGCEPGWQNTAQCKTACINDIEKEKKKNETTNEKFQEIEDQDDEDEESPETFDNTILYTTVQIRSKSIKTTDLPSVIKSMGSDTDKGFTEEFNSIPYGEQSDIICTVGTLPENIPKTRFKTTFPYDHSRVVLQSSKNGDYINANFIKNTDGDAVYIASHGKTNCAFEWHMI